jgi:phosphoglycerate kinase
MFHAESGISYLSTGGGAFLEALEGKVLPAVSILLTKDNERAKNIETSSY